MRPEEVLNIWLQICEKTNIQWYLYKETLLCAEGYGLFPESLSHIQIAVCTTDFSKLEKKVFSELPSDWVIEKGKSGKKTFSIFTCDQTLIMTIDEVDEYNCLKITCQNAVYPAFEGYQEYLEKQYGDYQNGLFDEIGCGLTVAEKKELRRHQQKCIEVLKVISDLGKKYNLRYYLIAGSVLGTVRHGGFIPWDDDIDIGIRIEDIESFEEIVKRNLPSEFTLKQAAADDSYPRMFSKICYDGRCCIDLWPLVPAYENGILARLTWDFGKIFRKLHYRKIGREVLKFNGVAGGICKILNDKQIMHLARWNERLFVKKNTPVYINLYSIYPREKECIRREWLDHSMESEFEGIPVPIVGDTDQYLSHLYGDYMKKPAPWKRGSGHVDRFY